MKHILSILFVFTSLSFVFSQNILDFKEYYIGTGYSAGFAQFNKINFILDKYDEANVQEKEFSNLRAPNGITFLAGTTQSFFNVEFKFAQLQQRRKTKFSNGTNLMQRDVRMRINSYSLAVGVFFPVDNNFGFGFNASADSYRMKLSSREAVEKSINRSSFITPAKDHSYGTTIETRFYFGSMNDHGTKFMIIPYYSLIFSDFDVAPLDDYINGEGSSLNFDTKQNMSHFGIRFIATYSVIK